MRFLKRPEIKIPLSFLVISLLWIVFSDEVFLALQRNITATQITEIQTIKGSFFVIAVSLLIHFMIKASNKKLLQSRQEYKDIFYNAPNPMMLLSLNTKRICYVNKAALDSYGYTAKEFSKMSVEDLRADPLTDKSLLTNAADKTVVHKKKNNDLISCLELSREITIENSFHRLLCVNDITELQKAKSELYEREIQLNQILNSITDGFFILSHDLVIRRANDHFKRMVTKQDITAEGQKLVEFFPEIHKNGSYEHYTHALRNAAPVYFESHHPAFNKWFQVSAYPFDKGLSVFFRDITKEKEDEIQRHQNEQNLLALINNTDDLMWSVDCNFRYFIFNKAYKENYKRVFGEDVYVGKCALNEKQGEAHMQKWKSLYQRALNGEKFCADMNFVIEESCYFATVHLNPIQNSNQQIIGVSCFLRDITERKLQIKRIEQQNEQLKQIAFITSHKVRVPLANILGLTEILDNDEPVNSSNSQIIEHLKTSAKQLDTTIINMVQQTLRTNDL